MGTVQDFMCYQINKFHRTTTLHPPGFNKTQSQKPVAPVAPVPAVAAAQSPSQSQPSSPTIKASTPPPVDKVSGSKSQCACKCQSKFSEESGSLELIQYYYCPDCERESKKSRTLRFGSGGDVIVDKSQHTYYNTIPPRPPAPAPSTTATAPPEAESKTRSTDSVPDAAKSDESSNSTFNISINLPKSFDFNLLANQSHHLRVNISICENKNSKQRALASLPTSPSASSRHSGSSSHSFTFTNTNGLVHSSSSCGHLNELAKEWAKYDIRHNLHLSGWYWGKMDWKDSIRVLKSTPIGTFLLRDSGDPNYCFSLSMQTEHGPISSRISYRNGKFRLDSQDHVSDMLPSFPNIISLVEHYIKYGLVKNPSGRQVWVDSHGLTFSPIHLKQPKKKFVPSLQHMARLAINRNSDQLDLSRREVPPTIQNYLNKYPHTV